MSQIWLEIFAAMIAGSAIKYMFYNMFVWVVIDLAVLGGCYFILRRWRYYVDMKKSMIFLSGITIANVLTDIGVISVLISNLILLGLLAWMVFGGRGGRPRRLNLRHKWHK
jgi:hypothetical protein